MQTLHTLRNLYFISSRAGQNSTSQYTFVNLTAIDILSQYPESAEKFLTSIRPSELGQIPAHPLERCLDLFFLNTAEHFTLVLSPGVNEELLIAAALPYLAAGGNNHLLEIFEAAHSVTLAVLASPHGADLTAKHLHFYVVALFKVSVQFSVVNSSYSLTSGIPTKPLSPSIQISLQNCGSNHCASFSFSKQPTPPPFNSPRARLR